MYAARSRRVKDANAARHPASGSDCLSRYRGELHGNVDFVQQYTQHIWKEFAEEVDDGNTVKQDLDDVSQEVAEENGKKHTTQARSEKEFEKQLKLRQRRAPDIVVLVGIPGSGKSTFSKPLEASGWKRISQDDSGRKCCEDMAGRFSKVGKVVLDRCNVEASERQYWLDLMHNPNPKRCAAVYFDFSPEECTERVRARQNHPTIRGGTKGSERIVKGFHERLEVQVRVLSETIQMQLVRPEEFRRRATRRGAAGEPQLLLQKELDQAVERESRARTVASALAVVSLVSVVVTIASSRRS